MARVLWRDAQGIEGSIDLGAVEIRIGRAMDCAIRTDDAMVSRHHARLYWGGHGYLLEDLGSANGVYYQEQRVQSHLLKHGDAVRCGSLWLRFVDAAQLGQQPQGDGPAHSPLGGSPVVAPLGGHGGQGGHGGGPIHPRGQTGGDGGGQSPASSGQMPVAVPPAANAQLEEELKRTKRRVEQLQTELRVYRTNKFNQETARRMEDLENDLSMMEIERDNLKNRVERADAMLAAEAGSVKVRRALEIASMTAEAAASLNDLLSSLRIEVMAAEGEFEQYAQNIPRASFELIRQSLKDAAGRCDEAREMLRKLREVAE